MQTFTIEYHDNVVVVVENGKVVLDEAGDPRTWGVEKTAIQWLRRTAQREGARYEVFKLDGEPIYLEYDPAPTFKLGEHIWKKANVMALADGTGPYDKLVCTLCGKIIRRYRSRRHFKEEHEHCPKNYIPLEGV